jgi:hypothetical protein
MQKALTQMNLQLHHVVSDITGVTGMLIIRAIVAGERDLVTLVSYRDVRCLATVETVRQALVGNDREEHVFALTQAVDLYDIYQAKVAACDKKIETDCGISRANRSDRAVIMRNQAATGRCIKTSMMASCAAPSSTQQTRFRPRRLARYNARSASSTNMVGVASGVAIMVAAPMLTVTR